MPLHPTLQAQLDDQDDHLEAEAYLSLLRGQVHQADFLDPHHLILTYHNRRLMLVATPEGIAIGLEHCPSC